MNMNLKVQFKALLIIAFSLPAISFAQPNIDKILPDFDYSDYYNHAKFMTKPYTLKNQTLYLPKISDTIGQNFFIGEIAEPDQDDNSGITYYKLKRMDKATLAKMEKSWFVVVDYIVDKIAFDKVFYAELDKQNYRNLQYNFIKLVVGNSEDTVFYNYTGFWNNYNFPFIPMSYFNANKNEYPKGKYINDDLSIVKYDTNSNYAYIPKNLVGQKITLPIVTEDTYSRLFNGTRLFNYDDDSRKYSFADLPIGKAKQLKGKTFVVADWAHDAEGLTNVYLKLIVPGSRDTVYYKYPVISKRGDFPFVVESYLRKTKEKYLHKEFVYRGEKYSMNVIDNKRKTPLTIRRGDIFQCIDFLVKDGQFQMLMRNKKGRKFYVPADYNMGDKLTFEKSMVDGEKILKYKDTYTTSYYAILQKELIPNMTMDMADMSWNKPEREVLTNFDGSNRHWFYMGNVYIIFKNNKLHRVAMIPRELRF